MNQNRHDYESLIERKPYLQTMNATIVCSGTETDTYWHLWKREVKQGFFLIFLFVFSRQ